jgi:hypothetical protein
MMMNICVCTQTMISLGDTQFRVLVLQGFWEKYCPNNVRRGDFSQNPKGADLAGQ